MCAIQCVQNSSVSMVKFYLSSRPDKNGECPIRVSISIRGTRLISTVGFNVAPATWSRDAQQVKRGCCNWYKVPYTVINARLKKIDSSFADYEIRLDHRPAVDELADRLASVKGVSRKRTVHRKDPVTVLEHFDRFLREESRASQWAEGTLHNWRTFRKHLLDFGKNVKLSELNEQSLAKFVEQLRSKGLVESSVQKEFRNFTRFLRWCVRKGFAKDSEVLSYKPRFRMVPKPVIFLTKEELMRIYRLELPDNDSLQKARDLFCFCSFTSLRYSDAVALKKSDISGNIIKVVTKKTCDALEIDLNDYSKAILNKYKDTPLPGNAALPFMSTSVLDYYCKVLGELCDINEPVTRILHKGGKRVEVTCPKWKLLSSHAGRRTFICFALSVGIPPQIVMKWTGHSDYKSMKPYIDIAESARVEAMKKINTSLV